MIFIFLVECITKPDLCGEVQTEAPESIMMPESTALLERPLGFSMDDIRAWLSGTVTTLSELLGWGEN